MVSIQEGKGGQSGALCRSDRRAPPANSVSITLLRLAFNNGGFDAFDQGSTAGAAIISIAEGGIGSAWFRAFAAADPGAVLGSVGAGPALPGMSAIGDFLVDTALNRFAMTVFMLCSRAMLTLLR